MGQQQPTGRGGRQTPHKYKQYKAMFQQCSAVICGNCGKRVQTVMWQKHLGDCQEVQEEPNSSCIAKGSRIVISGARAVDNSGFTVNEYQVMLHSGDQQKCFQKKFKDFCQLYMEIKKKFVHIELPKSSSKVWEFVTDIDSIIGLKPNIHNEKIKALEFLVNDLLSIDVIRRSAIAQKFFGL